MEFRFLHITRKALRKQSNDKESQVLLTCENKYLSNMKKRINFLLVILGFIALMMPNNANAQQDAQYTHFMFNTLGYNPAYAGTRESVSALLLYRNQWAGNIEGAPEDFVFNVHMPIKEKIGIGLSTEFDRIGVHEIATVNAMYSYRFLLGNKAKMSLALQGGVSQYRSDFTQINSGIDGAGDATFADIENKINPNFGFGLYFYTRNYYLSFSVPHLLNNDLGSVTGLAYQDRHYILGGGLILPVAKDLKLKPSVLLKSIPSKAPLIADINLNLLIRETLWIGGTYRTNDAFNLLAAVQVNRNLRVGYAYDFTLTKLSEFNAGSHEVFLGIDFGFGNERIVTPRYF